MQVKSANSAKTNLEIDSVSAQLNLTPHGIQLNLRCCQPNPDAIVNYRKGKVEFGLFVYQGVLFFLCKFGKGDWIDAPFHAYMNPPELRGFIDGFVPGKHDVALAVLLCDEHGEQKYGARLVTIGKKFSTKLQEIVAMQSVNSISIHEYERRIRSAFSKFTPERMVSQAVVKSIGGRDDAAANDIIDKEKLQDKSPARYPVVEEFMHVTLNTGHQCLQTGSDINDIAKNHCLNLINDSKKTGWVNMDFDEKKYPLHIYISESNLLCKLCFPISRGERPEPVIVIAIALDAAKGKGLWNSLHNQSSIFDKSKPNQMPNRPWILAEILPALIYKILAYEQNATIVTWAADFERVLAFSFSCYMNSKHS